MKTRINLVILTIVGIAVVFAHGIAQAGAIAGDRGTMLYTRQTKILTQNEEGDRVEAAPSYFGAGVMGLPNFGQMAGNEAPQIELQQSDDIYDFVVNQADETTPTCEMTPHSGSEQLRWEPFEIQYAGQRPQDVITPTAYTGINVPPGPPIPPPYNSPPRYPNPPTDPPEQPPVDPPVPEPGTVALMVCGLAALIGSRRFRNK